MGVSLPWLTQLLKEIVTDSSFGFTFIFKYFHIQFILALGKRYGATLNFFPNSKLPKHCIFKNPTFHTNFNCHHFIMFTKLFYILRLITSFCIIFQLSIFIDESSVLERSFCQYLVRCMNFKQLESEVLD